MRFALEQVVSCPSEHRGFHATVGHCALAANGFQFKPKHRVAAPTSAVGLDCSIGTITRRSGSLLGRVLASGIVFEL